MKTFVVCAEILFTLRKLLDKTIKDLYYQHGAIKKSATGSPK